MLCIMAMAFHEASATPLTNGSNNFQQVYPSVEGGGGISSLPPTNTTNGLGGGSSGGGNSGGGGATTGTTTYTIVSPVYVQLCQIRKLFCNNVASALIMGAIFAFAVLVLMGKATYMSMLIFFGGAAMFVGADRLVATLFPDFLHNQNLGAACLCVSNLQSLLSVMSEYLLNI